MQKAAFHNMPMAFTVAISYPAAYGQIPTLYSVFPYWWEPDTVLLDLNMKYVVYPETDNAEHKAGKFATATSEVRLYNLAWNGLPDAAPEAFSFLQNVAFSMNELN